MPPSFATTLLLRRYWSGARLLALWAACLAFLVLLGVFRAETDATYAVASLAVVPVLVLAWTAGARAGFGMGLIAALIWAVAEFNSDQLSGSSWIIWINAATRFGTYGLVAVLAAAVGLQYQREREIAMRDPLTGLMNRRRLMEKGLVECERSRRYAHPMAVFFLDLDNFKRLNDAQGHEAGDEALRTVAGVLHSCLRASDLAARVGGDEFVVLLPEAPYEAAIEAGNKISAALGEALERFQPAGASIGLAWFEVVDRPFSEMLDAADKLMYESKSGAKGAMVARAFGSSR